jgi:type IV pilus assembly protein PilA
MVSKNRTTQKGFSLVELLIVIAIMGVLAVIAFNAFNGVLNNSRRRADEQQAKNIERAVRMLVTETGLTNLTAASAGTDGKFKNSSGPNGTSYSFTADHEGVMNLIKALQETIYVRDNVTGRMIPYGPYLTNPTINATGDGQAAPSYLSYAPQWSPKAGGKHVGYHIRIFVDTQNVLVEPAVADISANTSYDPEGTGDDNANSKIESNLGGSTT